jgi:hypothetical protein
LTYQVAPECDALWRRLSANEQRALRLVALHGRAPYAATSLAAVGARKSSVQRALRSLLARGEIEETEGGRLVVVDPLLERWVERHALAIDAAHELDEEEDG